jgi:hypothetical protein
MMLESHAGIYLTRALYMYTLISILIVLRQAIVIVASCSLVLTDGVGPSVS